MTRNLRHRPGARTERGYVLILVLLLVLVLTAGAVALLSTSSTERLTFGELSSQSIAASRAQWGAQQMVAQLRAGSIILTTPTLPCTSDLLFCEAVHLISSVNTNVLSGSQSGLTTTAGSSAAAYPAYTATVFRRFVPGFSRATTIVSVTGFSAPAGSPNMATATLEIDLQTAITYTMGNNVAGGS
jgi:hypothetical protein